MTPEQLIQMVLELAPAECECFFDGLLQVLPVDLLIHLGESVASAIEAQTEKAAMQAGVQAVDATVDAAENADVKLGPGRA